MISFGKNIQKRRINLGLDTSDLAKLLNYSNRSYIEKIEADKMYPSTKKIPDIAKALSCDIEDLFKNVKFEDEEMNIFDEKVKEKEDSSSNKTLAYGMDERETIFLYSEIDNAWTISTNVRKHITKLMKRPEVYKVIREEKDEETGRTISIEVLVDDLENVTLSPFPRPKVKREMTEEERKAASERMKLMREKRMANKNKK